MGLAPLGSRTHRAFRPCLSSLSLIALMGLGGAAPSGQAAGEPPLADILARAGSYVHQLEQDFAFVICDEDYRQDDHPRPTLSGRVSFGRNMGGMSTEVPRTEPILRETRAEMLFVRGGPGATWLAVRNVITVRDDHSTFIDTVSGSKDRIDRALRDASPGQASRLRVLANEGARFNLGHIYRNFNTPTLALQFLAPEYQPRFTFRIAGREKVAGSQTVKLAFTERGSPTVIALNDKSPLLSSGLLWVRESDGAVLRTRLRIEAPQTADGSGLAATISVDYRRDQKLEMWLPSYMEEKYAERRQPGERIDCWATYSNFRRFETSGRIVVPQ